MSDILLTAETKVQMADAVETTLRYARDSAANFIMGPFTEACLTSGFAVSGDDLTELVDLLAKKHPAVSIEQVDVDFLRT